MMRRRCGALVLALLCAPTAGAQGVAAARVAARRVLATVPAPARRRTELENALTTEFQKSELRDDGDGFSIAGACRGTAVRARLVDLNGDTIPELHVEALGTCFAGMAGVSNWVFVRGADGVWGANLDVSGWLAPLGSTSLGYDDVIVGGPGFVNDVWRWNGRHYTIFCQAVEGSARADRPCPRGFRTTSVADSLRPFTGRARAAARPANRPTGDVSSAALCERRSSCAARAAAIGARKVSSHRHGAAFPAAHRWIAPSPLTRSP